MRSIYILFALFAVACAQPAKATGGLVCQTAKGRPIKIVVGFGHGLGSELFLYKLQERGREVPVEVSQWWMRGEEVRLALISPDTMREEAIVIANWNEETRSYDGSVLRDGGRRWIRCREG